MGNSATTIDEYLDGIDAEIRREFERMRALVTRLVPCVEESIRYRMPTLKYKGRALVDFTTSKKHMSFYPSSWAIDELKDQLSRYKTTEHAVQFTLQNPLSDETIKDLVQVHVRKIDDDVK